MVRTVRRRCGPAGSLGDVIFVSLASGAGSETNSPRSSPKQWTYLGKPTMPMSLLGRAAGAAEPAVRG